MKIFSLIAVFVIGILTCSACADNTSQETNQPTITPPSSSDGNEDNGNEDMNKSPFNRKSRISDVMFDSMFGNYGRLLFPVQQGYWSGETLEDLRLTYYNNIDPDKTVENTQNSTAVKQAGCTVETHILQNYPHGYGTGGSASVWGNDFDAFLTPIMQKNTIKTK